MMSKRDRRGGAMPVFALTLSFTSYRLFGLVTANIVARVLSLHTMPAFAIEIVCCSIASWMDARSCSRMEPNSSMQQTPRSASTNAPASRVHSPPSRTAEA